MPAHTQVEMFRFPAMSAFLRITFRILQSVTRWISSSAGGFRSIQWLSQVNSQKSISSLPPETLCDILYYLDARSLLSAKLTCRTFYNTTRSRHFWQRLLMSLESTSDGPKFHNKLCGRTIQELERQGIQRLRAYDCWVLNEPLNFHLRTFRYSEGTPIEKAQLLPGGRYLLANTFEGQFFVYDLDLPCPQRELLFDPGEYDAKDKTRDNLMSFAVWIDPSAEHLSFRVAVWRYGGPKKRGYVTRTRIYQVDRSEDGRAARWITRRIFAHRSRHYARKPSVGLSDRFLAEVQATGNRHTEDVRHQLVVRQYISGEVNQLTTREISVQLGAEDDVSGVFVSSHGHVVVISQTSLDIYMVSQLECHDPQQKVSPLHRFSPGGSSRYTTPPFLYRNFTWMVILRRAEYHVLRLSEDMANNPPLLTFLGRHPSDPNNRWLPGLTNQTAAAATQHDWSLNVVTYSWNVETTECTFQIKKVPLPSPLARLTKFVYCYATVGVDMISGRVVLLLYNSPEKTCLVFDTA